MKPIQLSFMLVLGAALGIAATGCGSASATPTSPGPVTALTVPTPEPSSPAPPSHATSAPKIKGKILSVNGTSSSLPVRGLGTAAIRVSLVGTALSTKTDSRGRFTFDNAPAGKGTLHFEGGRVNAKLAVELREGKELRLAVELNGQNANLVCETEIEEPEGDNNDGQFEGGDGNPCDQGDQGNGGDQGQNGEDGGGNGDGNS